MISWFFVRPSPHYPRGGVSIFGNIGISKVKIFIAILSIYWFVIDCAIL